MQTALGLAVRCVFGALSKVRKVVQPTLIHERLHTLWNVRHSPIWTHKRLQTLYAVPNRDHHILVRGLSCRPTQGRGFSPWAIYNQRQSDRSKQRLELCPKLRLNPHSIYTRQHSRSARSPRSPRIHSAATPSGNSRSIGKLLPSGCTRRTCCRRIRRGSLTPTECAITSTSFTSFFA